jgi:cbb3-type cytochrome oxidase subunit 3
MPKLDSNVYTTKHYRLMKKFVFLGMLLTASHAFAVDYSGDAVRFAAIALALIVIAVLILLTIAVIYYIGNKEKRRKSIEAESFKKASIQEGRSGE